MIKFILDAMYYQIFIFNRDKFILENPHERTMENPDDTDNMWNIISSCYSIGISTDRGEFQL